MTPEAPGRTSMRRIVGAIFVVAAFAFLFSFVYRDFGELREQSWQIRPVRLAASIVGNILALFLGVGAWKLLLGFHGYGTSLRLLARVWFVSGLGRYIPGKIWQFVGAAQLGTLLGIPRLVTVTSLLAHTYFFLIAAIIVSALLLPAGALGLTASGALALRFVAPLGLLAVHPALLKFALRKAGRLSGREIGDWTSGWIHSLAIVSIAIFAWIGVGLSLFLFLSSLTGLPDVDPTSVIAFNSLAFAAGYLMFIVPAGLGAKEGVLTALLAVYLPLSVAALLAVAARLWMIVAEVVPALVLLADRPATEAARPSEEASTP